MMIRLRLLGSAELTREDGTSVASVLAQPKRLALLAYLAVARPRGFRRRDRLLALCWPEKDQARARNALRQSLHYLRRSLGNDLIQSRGDDEIGIDPSRITVDVLEFETLIEAGEPSEALERYAGPFMDGFHLSDAPELERWFDGERTRLSHLAWNAAMEAAEAAGDSAAGLAYARTAVRIRPTNEVSVRALMALLHRLGDREGALGAYEQLVRACREVHDAVPETETTDLADLIRRGAQNGNPDASGVISPERGGDLPAHTGSLPTAARDSPQLPSAGRALGRLGWWSAFAAAAALVAAIAVAEGMLRHRPSAPMEVFESPFREGQRPKVLDPGGLSLSPDGTGLVYVGPVEGETRRLWVRRWSDTEATPIRGTEGARHPAISPDGQRLAFGQFGEIRVLAFDGGEALPVMQGTNPRWGPDGFLYASTLGLDQVIRAPSTGGAVETVTRRVQGEVVRWLTDVLPNGWGLLWVHFIANVPDEIRAIDLQSGVTKRLVTGSSARFVAETGHLLYRAPDARLMAAPLNLRSMEMAAAGVPLVDGRVTAFSVSEEGRLFYALDSRDPDELPDELVWVDRSGRAAGLGFPFRRAGVFNFGWSLSPDGGRLAITHRVDRNDDIWVKRLPDGAPERLTLDEGADSEPWWTPDGRSVTYLASSGGFRSVWSVRADGSGEPRLIHGERRHLSGGAWSPDGEWLVLETRDGRRAADIVGFRPGVDSTVVPLVTGPSAQRLPAFSPDGRWLAYSSNRTGRPEIYVRPFPHVDSASILVSTEGGIVPVWAHSGAELFFMDAGRSLVSARISTASGFRVTSVEKLFEIPAGLHVNTSGLSRFFDVDAEDQRFVMGRRALRGDEGTAVRTFLVTNFFEALRRERH